VRRAFRIVSGGQTGVDRAALDVARELGIAAGGWCPRGRRAEDGRIRRRYRLRETPSRDYAQRTGWNVRDSDGTLIVSDLPLEGGTLLTARLAARKGKPVLVIEPGKAIRRGRFLAWLKSNRVRVLNVAGPRGSRHPGLYTEAKGALRTLLMHARKGKPDTVKPARGANLEK